MNKQRIAEIRRERYELAKWLHNTLEGLHQDGAASLVEVENAKDEMLQRELEMLQEENQ